MKKFLILAAVAMLLMGGVADSIASDVVKALSHDLSECGRIVRRIADGSKSDPLTSDDIARLKKIAESIHADRLLMAESQGALAERAATLGGKATDRQEAVSLALLKNLEDLLSRLDTIDTSATPADLNSLKQILDLLVPKKSRPLLGTLPYRHTNYSPRELAAAPVVKPAYKGGDRNVYAADTATTPEAVISKEIVDLARSLQWNPVLMYEWVKNNVETEWYWGSMKGAEETLHQKSGNDADQAALLVALLRASGFPSRYIKGTIEFFPDIEKAKNITGLGDPIKIADFFQKAGIPFKPVIAGGKIANFQIEHIWVESFIPYANYRGAVLDDQGKIWLGLDTSVKPQGYTRIQGAGVPADILATFRDDYLNADQTLSPLDYLKGKLNDSLATSQAVKSWSDLKDSAAIVPEILKIIPASLQFPQIAITGEYQALPDELKHKLTFTATANNNELFSITLETHKLSNRKIALKAEPETIEDQNLIDSFGGLDNTPAYLVRLRPVLTLDNERLIVAQDGLPMGSDFTLNIDVVTPNGTERITSSHIAGNVSVIGVVSQKAQAPVPITEDDDAEAILFKETIGYIDRWNRSEDDLAALLGQRISRPTVSIATVGGQVEVSTLLDMPHDFTWKGLFLDAGYRRIEATGRNGLEKEFMRLSSLQGSILENRIFEDDLKVDSASTAKLLQLAKANGTAIITIDRTNIDTALPTIFFDDAIKADIANAVNQGLMVTIPQNEISYRDWSGIGYAKENPITGEAGWMLSGNVAGGMTAVTQWVQQNFRAILHVPYSGKVNRDPLSAKRMFVIGATDYQYGTVNTKLRQPLAVLVVDANNMLVRGARVTFSTVAGGGGFDAALSTTSISVLTDATGIARAPFYLGEKTGDNPVYTKLDPLDLEVTQIGLNLVTASVEIYNGGKVYLADSFSSYAKPETPAQIVKGFGDKAKNIANNPAGSLQAKVLDRYDNPVSNVVVQFEAVRKELAVTESEFGGPEPLPVDARPATLYKPEACTVAYPIYGECPTAITLRRVSGYSGCFVNTILGDTVNTKYTIEVSTPGYPAIGRVSFTIFSEGYRAAGTYLPHALILRYLEQYTPEGFPVNATKVGTRLTTPLTAALLIYMDDYRMEGPSGCTNPQSGDFYDCWRIVPSGKTLVQKVPKDLGRVAFAVTNGGGGTVSPTRDLGNGKYETDFTAGSIAELNRITVTGSAKVTVPEVFYDTGRSKTVMLGYPLSRLAPDRTHLRTMEVDLPINNNILFKFNNSFSALVAHDPLIRETDPLKSYNVFAVDTRLSFNPGSIAITKEGKAKRNTAFTYTILPAEYNSIISDIDFFTLDSAGREEWAFQLHGDKTQGSGTSIVVAGSQWDIRKKYLARVTLNNGSAIEIDGNKTPVDILLGAMVPDYNHDRTIDPIDRDRAELGDKYYFWVNDDDGNGDTEGTGIPGTRPFPLQNSIPGTRDLVDWFPVHLDIKELFEIYPPGIYDYFLSTATPSLRYIQANIAPGASGTYLTDVPTAQDLIGRQEIKAVSANPITPIDPLLIQAIRDGNGVILLEATVPTSSPLKLLIRDPAGVERYEMSLPLSIAGVEQMFRHKNLIQAAGGPSVGGDGGVGDRLGTPANFPETETNDKNFVFLHGHRVKGHHARGWHAEMFKRLYWSGSKAKFWGVSWYVNSVDYYGSALNAFKTTPFLQQFLNSRMSGDVTIAAHSLGNMVVSSLLSDYSLTAPVKNYFLINAAVASEAYQGDTVPSTDMVHPDWDNYKKSLWTSEWYKLFLQDQPTDYRSKLTWRDRFAQRPASTNYYNFYSSGEDVLEIHPHSNVPSLNDVWTIISDGGRQSWALQEKFKGQFIAPYLMGSDYGGWTFNLVDYQQPNSYPDPTPLPFILANDIPEQALRSKPFFKKGANDAQLFDELTGSAYVQRPEIKNRLLVEAIPARTLPAGRVAVNVFGLEDVNNFDMQMSFKTGWPRSEASWLHNDFIKVGYPYLHLMYDELVKIGGY